MHPDVGEADFTSHIHVPEVSSQSCATSDDFSHCTGHAAAASSQRSSVDVSRRKVGRIAPEAKSCEGTGNATESSNRSTWSRTSQSTMPELCIRTITLSWEFNIMVDRWPSFSRFGSSKLQRNHPHVAVFTLILRVKYMRPSELLELKKKDLVPSLVPPLSMLVGRDRSSRNGSVYQDWNPRWVGPHGPAMVSMGQQVAPAKVWESGRYILGL